MVQQVFLGTVGIGALVFFGLAMARWLKIDDPFGRIGMAAVMGPAAWMVIINALGWFMPVKAAVALGLMAVLLGGGLLWGSETTTIIRVPRWCGWTLGIVAALSAFVSMRFNGSDPWSWQHFPLAATIAAGNLPVMAPIDPATSLAYHYGPALLAASFHLLTGATLAAGFWSHVIIGSVGVVFFAAALAWRITKSWRAALLAGLLGLLGGGLAWLFAGPFIADLWKLAMDGGGASPFRHLTDLFSGSIATGLIFFFGHRSTSMGFPLLYGLLYVVERGSEMKAGRMRWAAAGIVLALALALTNELSAVALPCCMAAGAGALWLWQSEKRARALLATTCMVFVPALVLALFQGGVLSSLNDGSPGFSFGFDGTTTFTTWGDKAAVWSVLLWKELGLPVLLLPFTAWVAWKRRKSMPFLGVLVILIVAHLTVPFFVHYNIIEGEIRRLFYTAITVGAVAAGLAIDQALLCSKQRKLRWLGWACIAGMLASALVYLPTRLILPNMRWEPTAPLLSGMPPRTKDQENFHAWVREHTAPGDVFYVRSLLEDFLTVPDEVGQQRDRVLFMTYTGRFTVGPVIFWDHAENWLATVRRAEERCDKGAMRALNVKYLLVESLERDAWFRATCNRNQWEPAYRAYQNVPVPRVERLKD